MAEPILKALFQAFLSTSGGISVHTYDTLPDNDDIALTPGAADVFGVYAELAATVGTADVWLTGGHLSALAAADDAKVAFATGLAAAEVDRITVPIARTDVTAAGATYGVVYTVPFPIRVTNGTRAAARAKAGAGAGSTVNAVVMFATGLVA